VEIKAVKLGNTTINEFNLNVKVERLKEETADKFCQAGSGGTTQPKQG
jgi:hypothetical protein